MKISRLVPSIVYKGDTMKTRKHIVFMIIGITVILQGQAETARASSSFGAQSDCSIEDFKPHLLDDEGYYEEWSHGVWVQDGSFISVDFYISNLGIGDHKGAVKIEYTDKDGQRTKCKMKYDDDQWSYTRDKFAIQFGENKLSGDLDGLELIVKCKHIAMNLNFENITKPYKPGNGKLRLSKNGFFYGKVFTSPRSHVKGHAEIKGKKSMIVGVGQAEHSTTTIYPHKFVRLWFRFQSIDKEYSINIAEMEATSQYASEKNGWVSISDADGKLITTTEAKFQYDAYIEDSRSSPVYRIPRLVKFRAAEGNTTISGTFIMQKLEKVRDPLKDLDAVSRMVVKRFTKPKDYHISCRYQFKIQAPLMRERTIQGEGTYRLVFANP